MSADLTRRIEECRNGLNPDVTLHAFLRELLDEAAAALRAKDERLREHEQFRHQHRDCDKMGVELQQAKQRAERLAAALCELVTLKRMADNFDVRKQNVEMVADAIVLNGITEEYQRRKPAAWKVAFDLIATEFPDEQQT